MTYHSSYSTRPVTVSRIAPHNRTRARGLFSLLRASGVSRRRAYVATVATYGRAYTREWYYDMLPTHTRRMVAGLAMV